MRNEREILDFILQALRDKEEARRTEEVRLREAQLREQAARAELAALQARINPHFFFNTLNTISALAEDEPRRAAEIGQTLAELFRYTFKVAESGPVPLAEELDFVDIATTVASHRPLVELAAQAGVAMVCQKPFASSMADARAMVAAAEAADSSRQLTAFSSQRAADLTS